MPDTYLHMRQIIEINADLNTTLAARQKRGRGKKNVLEWCIALIYKIYTWFTLELKIPVDTPASSH